MDGHFERMRLLRKEKENLGGHQICITHNGLEGNFEIDEARKASRFRVGEYDQKIGDSDSVLYTKVKDGKAVPVYLNDLVCSKSGRIIPYSSVMSDPHCLSYWDLKAVLSDELVREHGYPPRLELLSALLKEKEKTGFG